MIGVSCLNKLDAMTKGTKQFSNPWVLSSSFVVLGTLQSLALRLLNHLVTLILVSNYYVYSHFIMYYNGINLPGIMYSTGIACIEF